MLLERLYDDDLAHASYVIGCQRTGEAIVVDPRRDVQVYLERTHMRRLALTTLIVIAAITLTSCAGTSAPQNDVDPSAVIIDVRTPAEHATGHLDGALLLDVTAGELQAALPDLDPEAAYLIYCRSGNRAGAAIDLMKQAGFTDLRNLGSLEDAANATGLPIVQP